MCITKAGTSPVAALISSSVGRRFSENCTGVQPPTTCTQFGAGVRWAWSRSIISSDRQRRHAVPPQFLRVGQAAADKVGVGIVQPGTIVRPPASTVRVFGPTRGCRSARVPTRMMRSPVTANASALGIAGSSVMILAFSMIRSA